MTALLQFLETYMTNWMLFSILAVGAALLIRLFHVTNNPFLIKSEKSSVAMTLDEMDLAAEATSMHQFTEWGM